MRILSAACALALSAPLLLVSPSIRGVVVQAQAACPAAPPSDPAQCDGGPCVVEIRTSGSAANPQPLHDLRNAVGRRNTTVRLGADVVLDFDGMPAEFFPIQFNRCVTLTSVASFKPEITRPDVPPEPPATAGRGLRGRGLAGRGAGRGDVGGRGSVATAVATLLDRASLPAPGRSASSPGPLLTFGTRHPGAVPPKTFLEVRCFPAENPAEAVLNDGARISALRIHGPSFGPQETSEVGIRIIKCVDVEIANVEIGGWGASAISVEDERRDEAEGTGRISRPDQIRILRNYIHHNQHPSEDGHAAGYGVDINRGAWARIVENVFDFNRHAIAANGGAGGYDAVRNLILKGGGIHGPIYNRYTHQFDAHGDETCGIGHLNCGNAGHEFSFVGNAFQFRNENAIKLRGKPRVRAVIQQNVFPHPGLEDDWGDDAVALRTTENVVLGPGNVIDHDSFGRYGVCDFDGDGVDDLFLPTGVTWWFSSFGEFQWTYLNAATERLADVRFGYVDEDARCDVLADRNGQWMISSGGAAPWRALGAFGTPLRDAALGRFDPAVRDHRRHTTKRTTHAFRLRDGGWEVSPLTGEPQWQRVQSSGFGRDRLLFGDFTGDAVTDVLAVVGGRWSISESARMPWRRLNPSIGTDTADLVAANMDADDGIDDVLRLERRESGSMSQRRVEMTWWRSRNGTEPWTVYKRFEFSFSPSKRTVTPMFGFAGRFGESPGGGVMVIDEDRFGRFFSAAEAARGRAPEFRSVFAY